MFLSDNAFRIPRVVLLAWTLLIDMAPMLLSG